MLRRKKVKVIIVVFLLLILTLFIKFLLDDPNNFGERSVGLYRVNIKDSDVNNLNSIQNLTLEIKQNNTYEFSKKLPFIDKQGKWELFEEDLVIYIILLDKNGIKDNLSICCNDNNEITFYCYSDKSNNYKRIQFFKVL